MGNDAAHLRAGAAGEDEAVAYLRSLGWRVTDRNWRPEGAQRGLELDIVARDGDNLVFVEVKTRRLAAPRAGAASGAEAGVVAGAGAASASEAGAGAGERRPAIPVYAAFTGQKKRRLLRAASLYLSAGNLWHLPCRFDFIGVELAADARPRVEHQRHVIESGHIVGNGHASWQPW